MDPKVLEEMMNTAVANALQVHLPAAVQTAVDKAVNGKVNKLTATLASITNDEGTGKLDPLTNAWNKWLSTRRIGMVAFGVIIALGGLITAAETTWQFIAAHFAVK